jgi:hypothetical protein
MPLAVLIRYLFFTAKWLDLAIVTRWRTVLVDILTEVAGHAQCTLDTSGEKRLGRIVFASGRARIRTV